MEAAKGMDAQPELIVHFDGSCTGKNPGGVAHYGWHIDTPNGVRVAEDSQEVCRGPSATNNVAEWAGLKAAILFLKEQGWSGVLKIQGDSALVINQLNGDWKCKMAHLQVYLEDCRDLLIGQDWEATWIPRESNKSADGLSRGPKS